MGVSPLERNAVRPNTILSSIIFFCLVTTICSAAGHVPETAQQQSVIIVAGAGGTAEYSTLFAQWARQLQQACQKGNNQSVVIGIDEVKDTNDIDIFKKKLSEQRTDGQSPLWIVLLGHGTYDGRTAKFNLRGPDFTADELAVLLKPFTRPVVVIDAFSSSAPFLKKLSAPGRVIVSATKSAFELNYSRFGQYFASALSDPQADLDKDGQMSVLEAFLFASRNLAEFYTTSGRLATEHPLLDDNGDGLGTQPDWYKGVQPIEQSVSNPVALDGYRAQQINLVQSDFEKKIPIELRTQRDKLELEMMQLRQNKSKLPENEYFSRLEKLLYEIALIYKQSGGLDNN
jgi:hypothetical protein